MKSPFAILFLALLMGGPWARAGVLFDNGAPNLIDGSEMTHWIDANQFSFTQSTILWQVRFWDAEASASFQGTVFWEICANSPSSTPGAVLFSGLSTGVVHTSTGRVISPSLLEFVDNFSIASISLAPGNYWLVLHNGPLSNNADLNIFWESATNPSTVPSLSDMAPFTGNWLSNGSGSQLAFQLYGVPASFAATVTSLIHTGGTSPKISFRTTSGQTYQVQYSNSLVNPSWTAVSGAENVVGSGGIIQITDNDPAAKTIGQRFYRVALLPVFTTG